MRKKILSKFEPIVRFINDVLLKIINFFLSIDDLRPITDWHTNAVLRGDGKMIPDLPVTQLGDKVVSIWKTPSFKTRLKFLITGKVNFQILRPTHAPIAISIGEYQRANETGEDHE